MTGWGGGGEADGPYPLLRPNRERDSVPQLREDPKGGSGHEQACGSLFFLVLLKDPLPRSSTPTSARKMNTVLAAARADLYMCPSDHKCPSLATALCDLQQPKWSVGTEERDTSPSHLEIGRI